MFETYDLGVEKKIEVILCLLIPCIDTAPIWIILADG